MLDAIHPWGRPLRPGLSTQFAAQLAVERWQLDAYWRLRRAIFAEEQGLFHDHDEDEHDAHALPIVAVSSSSGMPERVVGVVRIFEAGPGVWYGGRLGVEREYRRCGAIGTALIAQAVRSAHALGCSRFLATVQEQNVRYFERHHFVSRECVDVLGRRHRLMQADLDSYPPLPLPPEAAHLLPRPSREVA